MLLLWTALPLLLLVSKVHAIPILRNAKVVLNCAAATGAISCDWLCYDACVSSHSSIYLTAEQMEDCLSLIHKACSIPATAHNNVLISDYCSIDPNEDANAMVAEDIPVDQYTQRYPGYIFALPKISNQHWKWKIQSSLIQASSIDIDGDFDSEYCLAPSSYKITTTNAAIIPNDKKVCVEGEYNVDIKQIEAASDTEQYDTTTSFGFKKINLNFTTWAKEYESNYATLGEEPVTVHLSSLNTCWARANSMTVYYSVDFTIKTDELNSALQSTGSAGMLYVALFLLAVVPQSLMYLS